MKHLYNEQDDNMRSKLTEHEFGMVPGAWEDMESRLNQVGTGSAVGSASWSAWFIIGAMVVATSIGILSYQWQLPAKFEPQPMAEATVPSTKELPPAATEVQPTVSATNSHELGTTAANQSAVINNEPVPSSNLQATGNSSNSSSAIPPAATTNELPSLPEAIETQEQVPGSAPASEESTDGQRPMADNQQEDKNTYTRRTEVVHYFSESTRKWRTGELPSIMTDHIPQRRQTTLIDTPLIILENPFLTQTKDISYGISAGLNSKIYGAADRFSVAPVIGVFIRKGFDKQYAVQAELQYKLLLQQSKNDLLSLNNQPDYMSLQVDTDPGAASAYEERTARVYTIQRMHMFELPVSMIYKIHPRHEVSVGFKASYLFGVETASEIINGHSLTSLGFSSLDLGALAGYEFLLNDHLSLGLFYNVGFMNLARNTSVRANELSSMSNTSYQLSAAEMQQALDQGDQMLPVSVNEEEQIFLQAPRNLYNSDLRILLRYFF